MKEKNITDDNQSIYCYPGTSILKNKMNIMDKELLYKIENILVIYKLAHLISGGGVTPFRKDLTINHYIELHKYLFGDIYEFGGELRKEFINKTNNEIDGEEGIRIYCDPNFIYDALKERLNIMKRDAVKVKNREELINFLSENYMELYFIHPFREGNSRTLREFFREYVELMNKYIIDFADVSIEYEQLDDIDRKNFIKATIWNISKDKEKQKNSTKLLNNIFDKCLLEKQKIK